MTGTAICEEIPEYNQTRILETDGETAVIFLHGFMGSPFEVSFFGKALHEQGHAVYMPLMHGFGGSTEWANRSGQEQWVGTLAAFVDQAAGRHRKIVVAGFSLGGTIVASYLLSDRNTSGKVCGAVLVAPFVREKIPAAETLVKCVAALSSSVPLRMLYFLTRNPDLAPLMKRRKHYNSALPMEAVKDVLGLGRRLEGNTAICNTKTLLVFSESDRTVDNAVSIGFVDRYFPNNQKLGFPAEKRIPHQILLPDFNPDFDVACREVCDFAAGVFGESHH